MSLFSKIFRVVRSWRPRRAQPLSRRAGVAVEQLDHRQLLTVNFTGNVLTDFPASESPGVVVLNKPVGNPDLTEATPPAALASIVPVSGFNISDIRVSYDSADDTLSIGFDQPASGLANQGEVIAGDADDNGSSSTVNPNVTGYTIPGTSPPVMPYSDFVDQPDMEGPKYFSALLDFLGTGTPQIAAGFSEVSPIPNSPPGGPNPPPNLTPKPYEVADAQPGTLPIFGDWLTQYTGSVFLQNSPTSPNLEISITHFSQLYQMETGHALTSSSVIYIGGQAGSANDYGFGDTFFPEQAVNIGAATQPTTTPTPTPCPPQSPTILANPHEHRIIDTLHRDLLRVTVVGTSGFNVKQINPSTVTLDGVHPIADVIRKTRRDQFPMDTFVFVADQLNLPKGLSNVTLTGTMDNGVTTFQSSTAVLNIPYASQAARGPLHHYMGGGTIYKALAKIEAKHPGTVISSSGATAVSRSANREPGKTASLEVSYAPVIHTSAKEAARPTVSIKKADSNSTDVVKKLPTLLRHSMNDYASRAAADTAKARTRQAG